MKKFLLAVIPALLVLSACQAGPKAKDNNIFLEDTLAHEEIFDEVNFSALQPNIKKADPVGHPDSDPAIGIQSQPETGNKTSFRFVAAVSIPADKLESTVAKWTRTVTDKNGTVVKDTTQVPVTTAYTSLSNDGGAYTIGQFNADHNNASYTHFVVYTLRNIPDTYADAYVSAFLTLSRQGEDDVVTKAIATTVDKSRQFAYAPYDGAFFIRGTMSAEPIPATRIRDNDGNKAVFENVSLNTTDSFVIEEFYNSKLELHGSSIFTGDVSGFDLKNVDGKIGAKYKGKYNFYLKYNTDHNELWTAASNVETGGYLYIDMNVSWWGNDSAWTSIYAYKGELGDNTGKWFALTGTFWGNTFQTHTEEAFFTSEVYSAGYTKIAVCRLKNGTNLPDDKTQWNSSITHNVYSLSINSNGLEDCVYVYNNVEVSMGKRNG